MNRENLIRIILAFQLIEPVLRIHRAYRMAVVDPDCSQYILCELNSLTKEELREFETFKKVVGRIGSYVAAWYISLESHQQFWNLYHSVNHPYHCGGKYGYDTCSAYENAFRLRQPIKHTEL